ncbi:MAG: ubiquinol-cytochrome c reductase iron-sulfur subunit N-terminal domain-containing protein, partial [Pseudomonadota bacterium]
MSDTTQSAAEEPTRRDFIHLLAASASGLAGASVLVPLVHQMNPDASVLALSTKEVDI